MPTFSRYIPAALALAAAALVSACDRAPSTPAPDAPPPAMPAPDAHPSAPSEPAVGASTPAPGPGEGEGAAATSDLPKASQPQ